MNRTPPKPPTTTEELAELLFSPPRNSVRLTVDVGRESEHDDATARAFFGLPPLTLDDDADEG